MATEPLYLNGHVLELERYDNKNPMPLRDEQYILTIKKPDGNIREKPILLNKKTINNVGIELATIGAIKTKEDVKKFNDFCETYYLGILFKVREVISDFLDHQELVSRFKTTQPLHYDDGKKWWLWDYSEHKWQMSDETDMMIEIENALSKSAFTLKSKAKAEILEAMKRIGRRNTPEPAQNTWVQFKNMIYDVRTTAQFEASPEYFVTNPIPWKLGEIEDTPNIDRLFKEWVYRPGVQEETWAETLHEIAAYSLLQYQPLQKLFALTGAGANGKGTYTRLLQRLLGEDNYAVSEIKLISSGRFESAALYRKLAVFISEAEESDMTNTNLLKSLSGEDKIRYEFKGKDGFKDSSYATCILSSNSLPLTKDKSVGYYRRWIIVDFPNTFEVGDDPLLEVTHEEMENWCRKLLRIAKRLVSTSKFSNEGDIEQKTLRYEQRSNPVGHYIQTNYIESMDDFVDFKTFNKDLNVWLKLNNHRALTSKSVSNLLKEFGYPTERKHVKVPTGRIIGVGQYEREDMEFITKTVIYGLKKNSLSNSIP